MRTLMRSRTLGLLDDGAALLRQAIISGAAGRRGCLRLWWAAALGLGSCKPSATIPRTGDESPVASVAADAHAAPREAPNPSSSATISPGAIPVRQVATDLPVEVAAVSEGYLLLATADGRVEIRERSGAIASVLKVQLLPLTAAQSVPGGWVVIGSLPAPNEAEERGAAMRVGLDGRLGPTWRAPGLFVSVAANGGGVFASDILGPVYSLLSDGSLAPVQVPLKVQGRSVRVVFWGGKSVFCKSGELRKEGDPYGLCVADDGTSVSDVWRVPPIDCGGFLVADVQDDARTTSPWSRVIWPAMGVAEPVKHPLGGKPDGIGCAGGVLVDLKVPGILRKLPSLEELRSPVCGPESAAVVAGHDDVWCIGRR